MFENALNVWSGDIVRIHLITGKTDAGRLHTSSDSRSISLTGEVRGGRIREPIELTNLDRDVIYRSDAIIGIEYLAVDPT